MRFRFSRHAERQMMRRAIPKDLVEALLRNPQQRVREAGCKSIYQSQVEFGRGRMYLVRAVMAEDEDPPVVVTVYRTSRIEKYWRPE
jgi:hypothetical protein